MRTAFLSIILAWGVCLAGTAPAETTHYVDWNCTNPIWPYTDWSTAATNIQDAINSASFADTILVTNGIYQYGGAVQSIVTNRVYVPSGTALKIQSVNGPAVTIIEGYQVPGTTNGANAVRCVYLTASSSLSGFTLANGGTQPSGSGGGVFMESQCVVSNCIITGNASDAIGGGASAPFAGGSMLVNCVVSRNTITYGGGLGGGVAGGGLNNCVVSNNFAVNGGGVYNCSLTNCLLVGNGSTNITGGTSGGAAYSSRLYNCTVAGNYSRGLGAAEACTLVNSIIYYNSNGTYADCYQCTLTNCCTTIGLGNSSVPNNSISNAPIFVNPAGSDFHLQPYSPCVNAGNNSLVTVGTDLDGNPRIVNSTVDMGAYESQFTNMVHYVNVSNTVPVSPFTNWLTAATNIQDAVDASGKGDCVVVMNGVYKVGGRVVYGAETNRVVLTNAAVVMSVNGPTNTFITGGIQTRCAYVGSNAFLIGFTLTNGQTAANGDLTNEQSGGGAWCETGGVISNCIVMRNFTGAYFSGFGGGVYGGTIWNSLVTSNSAYYGAGVAAATVFNSLLFSNTVKASGLAAGGGAYNSTLSNCVVIRNGWDGSGGGAYNCALINCLIISNSAGYYGGGASHSTLTHCKVFNNTALLGGGLESSVADNCIIFSNIGISGGGGVAGGTNFNCTIVTNTTTSSGGYGGGGALGGIFNNCIICFNSVVSSGTNYGSYGLYPSVTLSACCTAPLPTNGLGNITNDPVFANLAGGDFHLSSNSPCINAGNNAYVSVTNDLDGNPRIVGGTVDIGACEYQTPSSVLSYAWAQQYGLPTDGSADNVDSDGDGFSNWQEWRAGTDPANALSLLQMFSPANTNNSSGVIVMWQSVSGINYFLQRGTDLSAQPPLSVIQSNIVGQAGTTSYTDTTATNSGPYFYRVGVQ